MRLTCPNCGARDLREFTYQGAALNRPEGDWGESWDAYVHLRDNPAGPSQEYWYHGLGCAAFLRVERDTRTHDILLVALASGGAA
ncbi:sarcosine oxidase subunit delta [Pseudooceanicola spongiae]|uniref:Sarcosine oxidase subunit delta n=1 Tax=Pseudooceanicola spongiae TaxID=2613965 RepID=A0A7L9WKE7_9RHOB|nr:sarcosine oxidase subunit delta [Pseudooceanicola spongiae]QOL80719.1 sarcosine oxidase subunit delta [Pseudooceanicola spongiae]